jgi:V8-like Glu-specific endopeptidase
MKTAVISSIATILFLCSTISCSIAAGIPEEVPNYANQDEGGKVPPIAADIINDGENKSKEYHFTQEEIDKNRIITIRWNGDEEVSTDEEVIQTLEHVRQDNSTFLFNEPHFSDDIDKRDIIGTDNRFHRVITQRYAPYSAVGYLSTGCTAYLVGPRHLITAAHCLHPRGNTGAFFRPSQLTFYLRRNCHTPGVAYSISQVLVYSPYRNSGDNDYNIAYLLLSATVYNWMGIAYRNPMPTVSGEICGYPVDQIRGYNCFYCSRCNDVRRTGWLFRSDTRLRYTCDTEGGMSGSPIITDDHDSTSNLYSYGVHTHGYSRRNEGVRISRNYFYDICRWMCNTGFTCSAVCL